MDVELLQPRLWAGAIRRNAEEIVRNLQQRQAISEYEHRLWVCGCETTIGTSCAAIHHIGTIPSDQQYALEAIQAVLDSDCMLIGGVQPTQDLGASTLQNQLYFLTRNLLIPLLPELASPIIATMHSIAIEEGDHELNINFCYCGSYYYVRLDFRKPCERTLHLFLHSNVEQFSPFSLEEVLPEFRDFCGDHFYLSNRVGMEHGLLVGGYSASYEYQGDTLRISHFAWPDPEIAPLRSSLSAYPKRTDCGLVYHLLVLALQLFFKRNGLTKAILGLSGGIDSALVLVIAARALGAENVLGVIMPSQYTADASVSSARALAKNLGVETREIAIQKITDTYLSELAPFFAGYAPDTTEENLQARVRAVLLMALSNKLGYALLNTSNKSEIAVGYSTMYGDACGAVSVIGALYKTEVYALAQWLNREREVIPEFIVTRPPSAELRPDQTDQDSLPPYEVLDNVLRALIDRGESVEQIGDTYCDAATTQRIQSLVRNAAYKRYQMPPCLRIAPDPFFDK